MGSESITQLLDRLDQLKRTSGAKEVARLESLLARLSKRRFVEALSLIRFHEALLFLRAYPQNSVIHKKVDGILDTFSERIQTVLNAEEGAESFSDPEVSGIVGTSLTASFSYPIARWLARHHPRDVSIDLVDYEDGARMGETLPRMIPLIEEDALVEANVPYAGWLRTATPKNERTLPWLIERFEELDLSEREKAELYDSLKLYITWKPGNRKTTRTGMKLGGRRVFYHDTPLLSRRDVSLASELNSPPLPVEKLARRNGEDLLAMIRDTLAIRYRELHGFTYGDPVHIYRADAGRGVDFYVNGVRPQNRLPLRAYHSIFMVKNGVPAGYVEGLSLFDKTEVGFNIYYTFRDGESAWIYARVLRLFRQLLGVTTFSVDPYQVGFENEEGIESGAFWFYRKLGFRPVRASVQKVVDVEEKKIASQTGYRTSPARLRQISQSHMLYELFPDATRRWDGFQVRDLGFAIARRMANQFRGDAVKMRSAAVDMISKSLGLTTARWNENERSAFQNFALLLLLLPDLSRWSAGEKSSLVKIIRAKAGPEESAYLRLMQEHHRFRDEVLNF